MQGRISLVLSWDTHLIGAVPDQPGLCSVDLNPICFLMYFPGPSFSFMSVFAICAASVSLSILCFGRTDATTVVLASTGSDISRHSDIVFEGIVMKPCIIQFS